MVLITVFLLSGILAGYFLRKENRIIKFTDKLTVGAICLLLFLLGLSAGGNEIIINSIAKLGIQAFVLTVGAISGSVLLSYFVYVYIFGRKGR